MHALHMLQISHKLSDISKRFADIDLTHWSGEINKFWMQDIPPRAKRLSWRGCVARGLKSLAHRYQVHLLHSKLLSKTMKMVILLKIWSSRCFARFVGTEHIIIIMWSSYPVCYHIYTLRPLWSWWYILNVPCPDWCAAGAVLCQNDVQYLNKFHCVIDSNIFSI